MEHVMKRILILALAAVLLAPVANSDPSQGKGQDQGQSQGQGQAQGNDKGKDQDQGKGDDNGKPSNAAQDNQGQAVSECNHRANERHLKDQERHDFVEWCTDRSQRHGFDDRRWDGDRNCYQKADKKGLSGDDRKKFVRKCLENQ
jgi:hypothetical protein